MLNNPQTQYVNRGESIDYTNSGVSEIAANSVVVLTSRIGIAGTNIPVGAIGTVNITGVYDIPATTTEAYTVGQPVYWDGTTITSVATDNELAGFVVLPKDTAAAIARVKIG